MKRFMSLVGWFLHNILLSWCLDEEIVISSRLVPTNIYKDKFLWFYPTRVSKLKSVYCDLSLHAFIVLNINMVDEFSFSKKYLILIHSPLSIRISL
jgi:hypothetical protein